MSTNTFTQRYGGVSTGVYSSLNLGTHVGDDAKAVAENRRILSNTYSGLQFMSQVHGDRVAVIERARDDIARDDIAGVDALITSTPGITLAVLVADCIPLLIRSENAVAAVHVGRKGLVNGLTERVIEIMNEMGSTSFTATIGPHICGKCYEVSPELALEVSTQYPQARSMTKDLTPALDIGAGLRSILDTHNFAIDDQSRCTVENLDLFSYRRDGVTGRQAGLISL